MHDLQHRLLHWNKGAERIYGWSSAEAVGKNVVSLIYPNEAQNASVQVDAFLPKPYAGEKLLRTIRNVLEAEKS